LELGIAEELALAVSRVLGQALLEAAIGQRSGKHSYRGVHRPCPQCGGKARFVGYRSRWLRTLCGDQGVERAYYHCAHCHAGQLPWDEEAGINARIFSPGLKALVGECCARLTHREVEALLSRVLGLAIEESSQQEIVGEMGARLRAEEAAEIAACFERLERIAPEPGAAPDGERGSERLYVGIDAAKAHTGGGWHDVKCAALYAGVPPPKPQAGAQAEPREPPEPLWDRAGPKRYVARQEAAAAFGQRVYLAALKSGLEQAREVVVLGDGAEWIWNLAGEHFHGATEILDYYHAAEHVWKVGPVLYGENSALGKRWAEERCRDLKEHGPKGLLRSLARRRPKNAAQAEALRVARGYFRKNQARMAYPQFRARGLMIGSGPVEAGCKVVVGQRLKGAGMRWSEGGADAMLAVRTVALSGQADRLSRAARAA
jgi:hypothetical protein